MDTYMSPRAFLSVLALAALAVGVIVLGTLLLTR